MSVPWVRGAAAVLSVMAMVGCARADDPGVGAGAPTGGTGGATHDAATGEPLLQVDRSGGFVLVGTDFASVPELTVLPDGTAITHGPQIAIFPPPALPSLVRRVLDDGDVDALLTAARGAGLLGETTPGYGVPPVADAPTTVVTLHVAGRTYVHAAEALGIADGPPPVPEGDDRGSGAPAEDLPTDGAAPGLTPSERDARADLAAFIARAHELVGAAGEDEPYPLDAFAVMARPAPDDVAGEGTTAPGAGDDAGPSGPSVEDGTNREVLPWPLDVALAEAADCVVVDGDAARTLHDALAGVSSAARFEQAGVRYDVWFRPLLPHEEGCDDVEGSGARQAGADPSAGA